MEEMKDILYAKSDSEMEARIWRQLNTEYFNLCAEYSWTALRGDPVAVDFSASGVDATGLWLPSDLLGIDFVWDSTNEVEFFNQDRVATKDDGWGNRYYTYFPSRTSLWEGTDCYVSKGGSSFTSALLTADGEDPDGQYVQFDDELGMYLVSSATTPFTFTPVYHGENKSRTPFAVRPWASTRKMSIIDEAEDYLYDRSVDVYYWKMPVPLYRNQDIILLPTSDILKFRTLRSIPESKGKFPVSTSMLKDALASALRANPKRRKIASARDKRDKRFTMTTLPFKTR